MRYFPISQLVLILILSLLSGCWFVAVRESATSVEPIYRAGVKIVTKHKYRLVRPLEFVEKDIDKLNFMLQTSQPDVFASDGIPVVVKERSLQNNDPDGFNPFPYIISASLLPATVTLSNNESLYDIVLTEEDAGQPIITKAMVENGLSFFPLCYFTAPLVFNDYEGDYESKSKLDFIFHYVCVMNKEVYPRESFAYALAYRLKEIEDSGLDVTKVFKVTEAPQYVAKTWTKKGNRYDFVLALLNKEERLSVEKLKRIKDDVAEKIVKSHLADHAAAQYEDLHVFFRRYQVVSGRIEGVAQVVSMRLDVESSYYDSFTRRGKIAFRVRKANYEAALSLARENISKLSRDKNIRLVGDRIPKSACFYIVGEKYGNGILELEYIVE